MAFLDEVGLAELWEQTKNLVNAHVWLKQGGGLGLRAKEVVFQYTDAFTVYYGDTVTVTTDSVTIDNPTELDTTSYNDDVAGLITLLTGKYVRWNSETTVYYFHGAEPTTDDQGNTCCYNATVSKVYYEYTSGTLLCDTDKYAYPPAEDDGFTYDYLGTWGGGARIATGSYTGTGTDSWSISLPFEPKFVLLIGEISGTKGFALATPDITVWDYGTKAVSFVTNTQKLVLDSTGFGIAASGGSIFNDNGTTNRYFAIG